MPNEPIITVEQLRQLLDYECKTGVFSWSEPTREWFASYAHWRAYKAKQSCIKPFSYEHSAGYLCGEIGGVSLLAHRVAWAYCQGSWPDEQVDHVNHDKKDNRLANLRLAPQAENVKNSGKRSDNSSGVTGVYWSRSRKKWVAQIGLPGPKTKPLGRYDIFEDAVAARKAAEIEYGFHENHGKNADELKGGKR
jgi:hypothetical protein